jgi:hypothetical protein
MCLRYGIAIVCGFLAIGAYGEVETTNTHDALQWETFSDRIIEFSGYQWRAKDGGPYGPGNNYFSDSEENVWVDTNGWLHLRITKRDDRWHCPEVALVDPLGYGDYIFKTVGRIDQLDPNVILGLFIWEYQESYAGAGEANVANEFDIEFGRWKDPERENAQYVCQPWQMPGNEHRFEMTLHHEDQKTSHGFLWYPSGIACRSWFGHDDQPQDSMIIHNWFYAGKDIPRHSQARVHINLWCIDEPPSDGQEHEVIIAGFRHVAPAPLRSDDGEEDDGGPVWWPFGR